MEYVVMPKEDWESVTESVRTKRNESAQYVSGEVGDKILSIPTDGGSDSEPVEQATPRIEVSASGLITASATQSAGYVEGGTKKAEMQLTTQAAKTITPSTSSQTAVASGRYTTGTITVAGIPSTYVKPTSTKGATTYTPGTANQTISAGTYCSGAQTIKGDANLVPSNIKKGVSVFGVTGTHETSVSNAKEEVEGWATPSMSEEEYIPEDGKVFSKFTVNPITAELLARLDPNFKPENIAEGVTIFGITGTHKGGTGGVDGSAYHYHLDDADMQWYESDLDDGYLDSYGYCPKCGCKLSESSINGAFDTNCPYCGATITYDEGVVELRSTGDDNDGDDDGTTGTWLFENEQITTEWNNSIPFLEGGKSYTAFVDGEEIATVTAGEYSTAFINQDKGVYLYCSTDAEYWCFDTTDSWATVASGDVSIRINETSGDNGGGDIGDAMYVITFPQEYFEDEWSSGGNDAILKVQLADGVSVDDNKVYASLYSESDGGYIGTKELTIATGGVVAFDFEGWNNHSVIANGYHSVEVWFYINGEEIRETRGANYP